MNLLQILILIFGASSIWIVGRKEPWRKYGFIIGLIGQPLWFYMAYTTQQWGVGIMCLFYTYSWASGVYQNIWKPWREAVDRNRPYCPKCKGWGSIPDEYGMPGGYNCDYCDATGANPNYKRVNPDPVIIPNEVIEFLRMKQERFRFNHPVIGKMWITASNNKPNEIVEILHFDLEIKNKTGDGILDRLHKTAYIRTIPINP